MLSRSEDLVLAAVKSQKIDLAGKNLTETVLETYNSIAFKCTYCIILVSNALNLSVHVQLASKRATIISFSIETSHIPAIPYRRSLSKEH